METNLPHIQLTQFNFNNPGKIVVLPGRNDRYEVGALYALWNDDGIVKCIGSWPWRFELIEECR